MADRVFMNVPLVADAVETCQSPPRSDRGPSHRRNRHRHEGPPYPVCSSRLHATLGRWPAHLVRSLAAGARRFSSWCGFDPFSALRSLRNAVLTTPILCWPFRAHGSPSPDGCRRARPRALCVCDPADRRPMHSRIGSMGDEDQ